MPIGGTEETDVTEQVLWDIELHSLTASVSNDAGTKGLVTGLDRGFAVVRAMSGLDLNVKATQNIFVASIISVQLTSGGSPDPMSISPGTPVTFEAVATFDDGFDPDDLTPEDETPEISGVDITQYVAWLEVHDTADPGVIISFNQNGTLVTDDPNIQTDDWVRVFCQYPGSPNPYIFFGYVATSNSIEVTFQ